MFLTYKVELGVALGMAHRRRAMEVSRQKPRGLETCLPGAVLRATPRP